MPKLDYTSYSDIKAFEYDDNLLRSLIENTKQSKDLEEMVAAGIKGLMKEVRGKEEPVESLDPATLDSVTRERLERLVETQVQNDHFKRTFYEKLGNSKAEKLRTDLAEQNLRTDLREFQEGKMVTGEGGIEGYIRRAQQAGLEDVVRGFAEIAYQADETENQVSSEEKILAAEILGKDVLPIKKNRLLRAMTFGGSEDTDYLKEVRKSIDGIPEEDVKKVAERAYEIMMNRRNGPNQPCHVDYLRLIDYLHAAQLAKAYLGEKELHRAGRELIETFSSKIGIYDSQYEKRGRLIAEVGLPDEMVRPLMLRLFEATLDYKLEHAAEIRQRYSLTDDEMRPLVNKVHSNALSSGEFEIVLQLRERYGSLIPDQGIPTEDVRTLARIMNYQQ